MRNEIHREVEIHPVCKATAGDPMGLTYDRHRVSYLIQWNFLIFRFDTYKRQITASKFQGLSRLYFLFHFIKIFIFIR